MKERPILFSGPMVRAILEGRQTQTRRVVKLQPELFGDTQSEHMVEAWGLTWEKKCGRGADWLAKHCPHGTVGDRLWVREAWAQIANRAWYRADPPIVDGKTYEGPWKPSIHMPRWASRITLEITGVRVERLQEISNNDAIAEGCDGERWYEGEGNIGEREPWEVFQQLWQSINGPESWSANPWVWVIEFRRR